MFVSSRDEAIGQAVSVLRDDQTQQAVADAMRQRGWKWSQATVWSVEKGERPLRLAEADDLAAVLGASTVTSLLSGPQAAELEQELGRMARAYEAAVMAITHLLDERERLADKWASYSKASQTEPRSWVARGVKDWLEKPDVVQEAVREAHLEREIEEVADVRRQEAYADESQNDVT